MDYGFDFNNNGNYQRPPEKEKTGLKAIFIVSIVLIVLSIILSSAGIIMLVIGNNNGGLLPAKGNTEFSVSSREVLLNNGEIASLSDAVEYVEKAVVAIGSDETASNGSGVVFTTDGFIVTNNHVVEGLSEVYVCLYNDNVYKAQVWATDEQTDLAIVKIDAEEELTAVTIGDSDKIRKGDTVFAIGNPTGELKGSVSAGIISYTKRTEKINGITMDLIQTDASVNPGNSGGGLFNEYGELVGIVNSKITGISIDSIGFAIPSNIVKDIAKELIEQKYVSGRPYLGLNITKRTIRTWSGYSYEYIVSESLYCDEIKAGDEIVTIGGKKIENYSSQELLYGYSVGDEIEVVLIRSNKTITVKYVLQEYKPS